MLVKKTTSLGGILAFAGHLLWLATCWLSLPMLCGNGIAKTIQPINGVLT